MKIFDKRVGWIIVIVVFLLFILFVFAYRNGKAVVQIPEVQWVSHTEYWSSNGVGADELASTIIRLTDFKGAPFVVDICSVTILYPNKSVYLSNQPMIASPVIGNWYRADPVPSAEGTYEQEVTCTYSDNKEVRTSQSFHVNPALNYIKTLDANILAADSKLNSVNLTIVGKINDAKESISTNINVSSTSLINLIRDINLSLFEQLVNSKGDLSTPLSDVQVVVLANIAGTNESIQTRIDLAETNLNNLVNSVNVNLEDRLNGARADLNSQLNDVNVSITGLMNRVEATIVSRIDLAETNLNDLIDQANSDLSSQLSSAKDDINVNLGNVNLTLTALLGETKSAIQIQLSNINSSVSELMSALNAKVMSYLSNYLPSINQTANNIYTDTQWLIGNALNQPNTGLINERFNSLDANISAIEAFCDSAQTSGSKLCNDIDSLKTKLDVIRDEQGDYFAALNQTTTNTWNLLSGTIALNIDALLENIGIIKGQTAQINKTLEEWKSEEESRVYINPIS